MERDLLVCDAARRTVPLSDEIRCEDCGAPLSKIGAAHDCEAFRALLAKIQPRRDTKITKVATEVNYNMPKDIK